MRPKTRRSIVPSAVSEGGFVKKSDGLAACRGEGEVEARAWRTSLASAQFDGELVAPTHGTISNGLIGIAGVKSSQTLT